MEIGRQNLSVGEETLREVRQNISKEEGMVIRSKKGHGLV